MDSKSEPQHFFVVLQIKSDLVEVAAAQRVALDATNLAYLLLLAVKETALALHAEIDRSHSVFTGFIKVVAELVVFPCDQVGIRLDVVWLERGATEAIRIELNTCPDVVDGLLGLTLLARIEIRELLQSELM